MLRVYGVGDHGGGPTRRDVERIIDMDAWPIFPHLRFGTYREFFETAEKAAQLPVVTQELNPLFDGCYTSQTRIKTANRAAERRLVEAETFSSLASVVTSSPSRTQHFARAWQAVMFNHFHDIITGSGTADTREYALGQVQRSLAVAGTEETQALRRIAAYADTSSLGDPHEDARSNLSEGAGAGWGVSAFGLSHVERGRGRTRIFHVFNPLPWTRTEVVEAVIWDWPGDPARLIVRDAAGGVVPHQVIPNEIDPFQGAAYWGHQYLRVLVVVTVPGCGYTTCSLGEGIPRDLPVHAGGEPRVQRPPGHILENERVRAVFDPHTASLRSFIDKESGEELLDVSRPAAVFRLVREDDSRGMTAWIVGQWMAVHVLHEDVRLSAASGHGRPPPVAELRAAFRRFTAEGDCFPGPRRRLPLLGRRVRLAGGRPAGHGVPQLNFFLPSPVELKSYRFDVPFGTIDRPAAEIDRPANSWVIGVPRKSGRKSLLLIADQAHGFRCTENAVSLSLIRSSIDPDPHPELGVHRFGFSVSLADCGAATSLVAAAGAGASPRRRFGNGARGLAPPDPGVPVRGRTRFLLRREDDGGRARWPAPREIVRDGRQERGSGAALLLRPLASMADRPG